MSNTNTIDQLQERAFRNSLDHGFWDTDNGPKAIPLKLMLIITEVAEAMEEYRSGRDIGIDSVDLTTGKPEGFTTELADICIRIFDLAGAFDLDLLSAILNKMEYNESRPRMHGKIA